MKNRLLFFLLLLIAQEVFAQQLSSFSTSMQPDSKSYLSISKKQVYTESEAADAKGSIDLAMVFTKDAISPKLEWYNLSGKDGKVPEKLVGTSAKIIAISFDREQFDKCKTAEDLKRMTGHMTPNSFSHYAVISHIKDRINYHCFIAETIDGKRALLWVSKGTSNDYKVEVKL